MFFRVCLISCLLLSSLASFPQGGLYRVESTQETGYLFSQEPSSHHYFNYQVLNELSIDHLVDIPRVKLRFSARVAGEVRLNGSGEPELWITVSDPHATGNTLYRGFDVSGFLVPSRAAIEVTRCSRKDNSSSRTFIINDITVGTGNSGIPSVSIGRFDPAGDTLLFSLSSPRFSEKDLAVFREHLALIKDYYASALLLDSALAMGARIRLDSLSLLPYAFCDILELSKIADLVTGKDFVANLLSGTEDPLDLERKRTEVWKLSKRLAFTFQDVLSGSGRIMPPAGIDSISAYFVDGLVRFIGLSSLMGDHSGSIYEDYLSRYFLVKAFPDDRAVLDLMARKLWPEAAPDTLPSWISSAIFRAYLDGARRLILENRNADAQALLRHALLFGRSDPWLKDTTGIRELMEEASGGIYASYLGIAEAGIDYGKLNMAELYLGKAREYRRSRGLSSEGDTLGARISGKLFQKRLSLCNWKITERRYSEAIDCFCELEGKLKEYVEAAIPDSSFQGRDGLQQAYHSIRRDVHRQSLLEEISDHGRYIWEDELDSARIFLNRLGEKMSRCDLAGDSVLLVVLREYEGRIAWIQCSNALEETEILIVRASRNAEAKRYAVALGQFTRAGDMAGCHADCGMKFPGVGDSIALYRAPARYQSGVDTLGFLYATGEFEKAVRLIPTLQDLYRKDSLHRFGLDSLNQDRFVREKENPAFTLAVSRHLLESGDLAGSLFYLKLLKEQGASPSMSADLQSELGVKLAGSSSRTGIRKDCKDALLPYEVQDPWYKTFREAYCKLHVP